MVQNLSRPPEARSRVSFTPVLVPMSRGILATVSAPARGGSASTTSAGLREGLRRRAVRSSVTEGQWPTTASTLGANTVLLQVALDQAAGRVVVVGAVDNLTKGTAGAAVQCLNLALGLAGDPGPTDPGMAP